MPSPKSQPQPPTSVHHTPPASGEKADQASQAHTLRHNTEGGQAQPHPGTAAGQHATGSFTSYKKPDKKKSV
jgi:hypothetical protein